jgi:nicotinate-nucleotide adenylyltransferase
MDRLGILGGTFNPPHRGHLALACHAREQLGLERVLLMPACASPGKPPEDEPNPARPEQRLEMCRLAAAVEGLCACALEIERGGPSYTVDTLRDLHAAHPDTELTLILGADVARTLPSWHEALRLPGLARLAIAQRADSETDGVLDELERLGWAAVPRSLDRHSAGGPVGILNMPTIDVSSSLVRERVRRGLPIEELVGPAVAAYIAAHRLYRARAGAGVS